MNKYAASLTIFLLLTCFGGTKGISQYSDADKQQLQNLQNQIQQAISGGQESQAASYYNQAANIHWNALQFDKAVESYQKALGITTKMNNSNGTMVIHNSLGMIYIDMEQYQKAIEHLEKGMEISRQMGARETVASTLTNLATANQQLGNYDKAISLLEEAVSLSNLLNDMVLLRRCYGLLYEVHNKAGHSDEAYKYFSMYSSFDKEIKKVEMEEVKTQAKTEVSKAVAEKQEKEKELHQTTDILRQTEDSLAKVEELTVEQRLQLKLKESQLSEEQAKTKARNRLIMLIGIALVLTLLFLMIVVRQKKAIQQQKSQIERQNKNITASLRYAQTIQNAILPPLSIKNDMFETFTVYRPKDIVSGDFYWYTSIASENGTKHLISVIDCTGHGVPGAFMSMIGSRLLNELVNERKITSPANVLTELNNEVRLALKQEQTDNNDGMDLSLCLIEKLPGNNGVQVTFSGAKRPLYYVVNGSKEITRVKGVRKSIGGIQRNENAVVFTNETLTLQPGDIIYQFSDGIVDQNDETRKRFGSQRLEELFKTIHPQPLEKQKEMIENELDTFIGHEEQRDDISLMGIKLI